MLTNVTTAADIMAWRVVSGHPNAWECQIFRRVVNRVSPDGSEVGGIPTLGGLGVISAEDEPDLSYEWVGSGFALQAERFSPSRMVDLGDASHSDGEQFRYLIAPEQPPGEPGSFAIRKGDVMYLILSSPTADDPDAPEVKLAWEIIGLESVVNAAPFGVRYICNRRDDLHVLDERLSWWQP